MGEHRSAGMHAFIEGAKLRSQGYEMKRTGSELQTNAVQYKKGNKNVTVHGERKKDAHDSGHVWF